MDSSAAIRASSALIFGACLGGHGFDGLELLARHEIHVGDEAFQPLLHERVDFVTNAFGGARGVGKDLGPCRRGTDCRSVPSGSPAYSVYGEPEACGQGPNLTGRGEAMRLAPMVLASLPFPDIDRVAVHIWGPIAIRWYALAYIAGLLFGWWAAARMTRERGLWKNPPFNGKSPITADQIGDLVVWATFGVILGGRIGWILFLRHSPVQRFAGVRFLSRFPWRAGPADGVPHRSVAPHHDLGGRHVVSWRARGRRDRALAVLPPPQA